MPVRNQIPSPATMNQGIVTILGSDGGGGGGGGDRSAVHIRRTLSADMSSRKWLQQSGFFSTCRNSPSSSSSSSSEGEEDFRRTPCDRDDVWGSIQSNSPGPAKMESWDSILSQKRAPPAPYVHPLAKRSSSGGLSMKSLEICTESLGSESGSDCFRSANCSTKCLSEVNEEIHEENRVKRVVRYKSSPARPLPPPLQSIAAGGVDGRGSQLHMQSRRENGRLIVEAVSLAPDNYFEARRGEGRLVLTLVRGGGKMAAEGEEKSDEEVFANIEEVVDDGVFVMEKKLYLPNVYNKGLVMKTFVTVGNPNAAWSDKAEEEEAGGEEISIVQALPPFPILARLIPATPTIAATSFNTYEYFWRNKTKISCGFVNPVITASPQTVKNKDSDEDNNNNDHNVMYENRNLVIVKGNKGEHLVPYSTRGCMEQPRRSLLFLESYCITTS